MFLAIIPFVIDLEGYFSRLKKERGLKFKKFALTARLSTTREVLNGSSFCILRILMQFHCTMQSSSLELLVN